MKKQINRNNKHLCYVNYTSVQKTWTYYEFVSVSSSRPFIVIQNCQ